MSRRRKRANPAKPSVARELVRLKAPAGSAPFKRGGRRYVPSKDGIVAVPKALLDDLVAHGFTPLADAEPAASADRQRRGAKNGGG